MSKDKSKWQQGLSVRHIAQIIRRKMITRSKPSAKVYDRSKSKSQNTDT